MSNPNTFQVGQRYEARSASNYDCVWSWTVVRRTAKFITVVEFSTPNTETRIGVRLYNGVEYASPLGRYSMSPSIAADRPAEVVEEPAEENLAEELVAALSGLGLVARHGTDAILAKASPLELEAARIGAERDANRLEVERLAELVGSGQ